MTRQSIRDAAAVLYVGGWRSSDRDNLINEYGHAWSDHGQSYEDMIADISAICDVLAQIEGEEAAS